MERIKPITILMADDDADDCLLVREALKRVQPEASLHTVSNGEELLECLQQHSSTKSPDCDPLPGLILLDLNMPKADGREALRKLKSSPELRRIPVVVLSTSSALEDIRQCYDLGANSFITKPANFDQLVEVMQSLGNYWFDVVSHSR